MHAHRLRLPHRTVFTTAILEIADQLLLLGVDGDRRLARRQRLLHLIVDIAELRIAVGMVRPLEGLAIGLQAIAQLSQQIGHHIMADAMTEPVKPGRQMAQALRRPQQWCHRIAARRRLDQFLEIGKQRQVRAK